MNNSSSNLAYMIGMAAADKKAEDIKLLNVTGISPLTDFFVMCSGNSMTQVMAIADQIEEKMVKSGYMINHREGYNDARWILLDYGDVIANIFYKEDREFYDIERLWSDAEIISL